MKRWGLIWLSMLFMTSLHGNVIAEPFREKGLRHGNDNHKLAPLPRVIALTKKRFTGDVIDAQIRAGQPHEETPLVYELRLLTEAGHILKIRVDALNADFLEAEGQGLNKARRAR